MVQRRVIIQANNTLMGLCYSKGSLYVVERHIESDTDSTSLAVYRLQGDSGDITLLDRLELWTGSGLGSTPVCPRVDRHGLRVFVPCHDSGVTVACLDGDRLVRERTLTCVLNAVSVDVMSQDTVYVVDGSSNSVHVVDVRHDRITSTLEAPDTVRLGGACPYSLAVLGDGIMVSYGSADHTLVLYRNGSNAPVQVMTSPGGLKHVTSVSNDCHNNYLVTDYKSQSIFVMKVNGELRHTVNINADSKTMDCVVVNKQVWVGCQNGDLVVMSSQ